MRRRSAARRRPPSSRTTRNKRRFSSTKEIVMQIVHHCNHKRALATRLRRAQGAISKENEAGSGMKIGFIGAGNVTATIGRHLINTGRTIVVSNSRGPETLRKFVAELGPSAIAGTK